MRLESHNVTSSRKQMIGINREMYKLCVMGNISVNEEILQNVLAVLINESNSMILFFYHYFLSLSLVSIIFLLSKMTEQL